MRQKTKDRIGKELIRGIFWRACWDELYQEGAEDDAAWQVEAKNEVYGCDKGLHAGGSDEEENAQNRYSGDK